MLLFALFELASSLPSLSGGMTRFKGTLARVESERADSPVQIQQHWNNDPIARYKDVAVLHQIGCLVQLHNTADATPSGSIARHRSSSCLHCIVWSLLYQRA